MVAKFQERRAHVKCAGIRGGACYRQAMSKAYPVFFLCDTGELPKQEFNFPDIGGLRPKQKTL